LVSRGRVVIVGAFAGLGLLMLYLVLFANSGQLELQKVNLDLTSVKVLDVDKINKRASLEVAFLVTNPSSITATIPSINYELFANGVDLGAGHYSTEDIPMAGRAALFANSNVTLTDTFALVDTEQISGAYESIISGKQPSYKVTGQVTVESSLTLITKDFESSLG